MHALVRLADLAPVELAEHVVLAAIAALAPEEVVRTVARRRARIVGAALDRAERGHRVAPEPARPCLAFVEEAMADATPSPAIACCRNACWNEGASSASGMPVDAPTTSERSSASTNRLSGDRA